MSISETLTNTSFYGILDSGYVSPSDWIQKFEDLANGGARVIQIRTKKESHAAKRDLLLTAIEHIPNLDTSKIPAVIVNCDLELALEFPQAGLHIGQDNTSPSVAREALGPDRILGVSARSRSQVDAVLELPKGVLSYFSVGPVFPTQTKPDCAPAGLELVRYAASKEPDLPFFCVGGINRENASQVAREGGKRVVAVSDVLLAQDTSSAVSQTIRALTRSD